MTYRILFLLTFVSFQLFGSAQSSRYADNSVLSSGKWVKIRVSDEGVYQLTKDKLKAMGFSNPDNVRLYGYNMPVLPETSVQDVYDDLVEIPLYRIASKGTLLFYSYGVTEWTRDGEDLTTFSHFNNPYSNYVYYFLTESADQTPASFEQIDAAYTGTMTQTTTYAHSIVETDAYSFLNCGRTFYESYDFANGNSKSYVVSLPGNSGGDVNLHVKFAAAGSSASRLYVYSGSTLLDSVYYHYIGGSGSYQYEYAADNTSEVSVNGYESKSMVVTLRHQRSSGTTGHLDYIQADYERSLTMSGVSYLTFSPNTSGTTVFEMSDCDANTSVWNVTTPYDTYELKGTLDGTTYKVLSEDADYAETYIAVNTSSTFPVPEVVGRVTNQDLHSLSDIQFVIIVPSNGNLTSQAQRLADAHTAKEGMKCRVVTAEQVYNEFSSGTPDATAYRRFMKMLYDKSADGVGDKPENLLLFGACVWDNRLVTTGLTGKSQDDYLLCYESDKSWSHTQSYVLEEYFGLLDDSDGSNPPYDDIEIGVGRIPVTTADEAEGVVDKLISYINNDYAGAWKNTVCFLADDGNQQSDCKTHMQDCEDIIASMKTEHPDFKYQKIYWDAYTQEKSATGTSYPGVESDIDKVMDEGALIMNYVGHGASYCLSHEQVMKTSDFQEWSSPRVPLWVTAACDVVPFDMNTENIGVEAVLNPDGAAMGFVGTARTVYSTSNKKLCKNFYKYVFDSYNGKRYTIGQALSIAKNKTSDSYSTPYNKNHFILIGDPAITLPEPTYKVVIDSVYTSYGESGDVISAGDVVIVSGHVVNESNDVVDDFSGLISPTIYDNEETVTTNDNLGYQGDSKFTYDDYTRKLFEGSDSIVNGRFSFSFPVPLDNNYSGENGLISLYAIDKNKTREANGSFTDFVIEGTSENLAVDTIGPSIVTYFIDDGDIIDGSKVSDTPTIYIVLSDSSGINATGNGLGHDIVSIIDGKESLTYTLNNYYTQTVGDYTSGTVTYTLPSLEEGSHTMTVRAFDTYNNMSEMKYTFEVIEGLEKSYEVYDFAGRLVSTSDNPSLPVGAYVMKTIYTSNGEEVQHSVRKFMIRQ